MGLNRYIEIMKDIPEIKELIDKGALSLPSVDSQNQLTISDLDSLPDVNTLNRSELEELLAQLEDLAGDLEDMIDEVEEAIERFEEKE